MAQMTVAASTFPFLYSHDGLGALKHRAVWAMTGSR